MEEKTQDSTLVNKIVGVALLAALAAGGLAALVIAAMRDGVKKRARPEPEPEPEPDEAPAAADSGEPAGDEQVSEVQNG